MPEGIEQSRGGMSLERFAQLSAALSMGRPRAEVLSEAGFSQQQWAWTQLEWLARMAKQMRSRNGGLQRRFDVLVAEEKQRLDEAPPSKAPPSKAPRNVPAASVDESFPVSPDTPLASRQPVAPATPFVQSAPAVRRSTDAPAVTRAATPFDAAPPPSRVPATPFDPKAPLSSTLEDGPQSTRAAVAGLPFDPKAPLSSTLEDGPQSTCAAVAATPFEQPKREGSARAAAAARLIEDEPTSQRGAVQATPFDPPPVAQHGTSKFERKEPADERPEPPRETKVGGTMIMDAAQFAGLAADATESVRLTLEQFAALTMAIGRQPDAAAHLAEQYGLTPEFYEAEKRAWREQMEANRDLSARYVELLKAYRG